MTERFDMKIILEEEYGYRYWLWDTGKEKQDVLSWWADLDTVEPFFFNPSKSLPFGVLSLLEADCSTFPEMEAYMHLHEDEDSYLRVGTKLFLHKGHKEY